MSEAASTSVEFIRKNATFNDNGNVDLSKTHYLDFMEQNHSIPKATINAVVDAEKDLVRGAVTIADESLQSQIAAAKDKGEDTSDLRAEVNLGRPFGALTVGVQAEYTVRDIKTKETSVRHGRVFVRNKAKVMLDKAQVKGVAESIEKLMAK